ncbi:DNA-processing protein DprA [Deinococcus sp. MIMF12]|uniref:DNA-processing protein DprA n=1 Tax=Deinococcus rhizophilus TaxID=3049544 RepID=A0ABT7JEY2_9DEIO|nr:DNA-processing protein DprA [Deinococcus rhizophilus]MDL2343618.1 DNA-processing protein DprA [Deinococcus rhizophilus]
MTATVSQTTRSLLTLNFVRGIGPRALARLSADPRFPRTALEDMDLLLPNVRGKLTEEALDTARSRADENVEAAARDRAHILSTLDPGYPPLLRATPDAPPLLFVKGALRPERCLAVIGTREPTPHGEEIARRATRHFAERGWSIVSGLALGVDALAHRSTLDVGGHTVAVLAHGLQTVAPRRHQALAEQILEEGGALVTEYPYGTAPIPPYFAARDRIQAGLAQGVLMVQSGLDGGSLHASRAAVRYRRLLAVPVPTAQDRAVPAPEVQANLTLLGTASGAAALLQCATADLELLVPLPSREAYAVLEARLQGVTPEPPSEGLF